MIDRLHSLDTHTITQTRIDSLVTDIGYHLEPAGILCDKELRDIYSPSNHHIRDWMHTLVGDGVANTEVALLIHHLKSHANISLQMLQTFCKECKLPHMHGKFNVEWLKDTRLKAATLSSFASIMLSLIPLLALFLEHYDLRTVCPRHVRSFMLLHSIVSLLRLSSSKVANHTSQLTDLIKEHQDAFLEVYGEDYVKPKMHQLHHVVDGIIHLGKCMSCFVCERKHRDVKKSAVHVFRNFEHTTLIDSLNSQIHYFSTGHDLFKAEFLAKVKLESINSEVGNIIRSTGSLVCAVGEIFTDDVLFLKSGVVLQVIAFFQYGEDEFVIHGNALRAVQGQCNVRSLADFTVMFVKTHDVADVCIFFSPCEGIIKVSIPPHVLFQ